MQPPVAVNVAFYPTHNLPPLMHHPPTQPTAEAEAAHTPRDTGRPLEPKPNTKKKYSLTTLGTFYFGLVMLSCVRLIMALVVLGLCAGILSKGPTPVLMAMSIYGIIHVGAFPT
jgi:hypothetical protein